MGWGQPQTPRPHDQGGIVIEVAAADHLDAVEAERDRYRQAIEQAAARLDEHPLTKGLVAECRTCGALSVLRDALEGGE